jgi:hypothetical protein
MRLRHRATRPIVHRTNGREREERLDIPYRSSESHSHVVEPRVHADNQRQSIRTERYALDGNVEGGPRVALGTIMATVGHDADDFVPGRTDVEILPKCSFDRAEELSSERSVE